MPELPEVEIMSRNLHAWCAGETIERMEVLDERMTRQSRLALSSIDGQRVERVYRRAKYSVIEAVDHALILHFRMTGKVVREAGSRSPRVVIHLESAPSIYFLDTRRFGTVDAVQIGDVDAYFAERSIGDEPWPIRRKGAWWKRQLSGLRGPIKPSLMKQERVAGLGNILASEIVWAARLDPKKAVPELSDDDWDSIAEASHEMIDRVLAIESGSEIVYIGDGASPSESGFSVYGQEGGSAPCCGGPIARIVQSGRSTFFCPACQTS